jgi:hypothetical protein
MIGEYDGLQTTAMKQAFDEAWRAMSFAGSSGRSEYRLREQIALSILRAAVAGERSAHTLCREALRGLAPRSAHYVKQVDCPIRVPLQLPKRHR